MSRTFVIESDGLFLSAQFGWVKQLAPAIRFTSESEARSGLSELQKTTPMLFKDTKPIVTSKEIVTNDQVAQGIVSTWDPYGLNGRDVIG